MTARPISRARAIAGSTLVLLAACAQDRVERASGAAIHPGATTPRLASSAGLAAGAPVTHPSGPRLHSRARYLDLDRDGAVGAGDELILPFTMEVLVRGDRPQGVELPVTGDTLGAGARWRSGPGPAELTLILGEGADLQPRQDYRPERAAVEAASGIALLRSLDEPLILGARTRAALADGPVVDILPDFVLWSERLGSTPSSSLAIGDVDRDGDLDVVSGHRDYPIHIILSRGAGAFDDGSTELSMPGVEDLALADLDGDADLDLVAASSASASTAWANDGHGNFERAARFPDVNATALALGDLNRDGWIDLVFGADGAERVWFGRGAWRFEPGATFGATPTDALLCADLDADGDLDLVDLSADARAKASHVVWKNTGKGRFVASQRLGGSQAEGGRLADLDRDGDIDLLLGEARAARVLLNDGRGRLLGGPLLEAVDAWPPAVGDIDGDGIQDLTVARSGDTTWLRGLGNGAFESVGSSLAVSRVLAMELADLDLDGDLDLCMATQAGIYVAGGSCSGSRAPPHFTPGAFAGNQALGRDLALGDLDRDGWIDCLSAGSRGIQAIVALPGGREHRSTPLRLEGSQFAGATSIALADLDRDGRLDWITGGVAGAQLFSADESGVAGRAGALLCASSVRSLRVADFDGDGAIDVALGCEGKAQPTLYFARGRGDFTAVEGCLVDVPMDGSPGGMAGGDFDCDGREDLLLGSTTGAATVLWSATRDGQLEVLASFSAGFTHAVASLDLERDGDLDVVTADAQPAAGQPCVRTWVQAEDGSFSQAAAFAEGAASALAVADVDADGRAELWIGFLDRAMELWRLTAAGWQRIGSFGAGPTQALLAADFDRDADIDILQTAGEGQPGVLWWNE